MGFSLFFFLDCVSIVTLYQYHIFKSFTVTHFDLVEGTQTVVPGWDQVW